MPRINDESDMAVAPWQLAMLLPPGLQNNFHIGIGTKRGEWTTTSLQSATATSPSSKGSNGCSRLPKLMPPIQTPIRWIKPRNFQVPLHSSPKRRGREAESVTYETIIFRFYGDLWRESRRGFKIFGMGYQTPRCKHGRSLLGRRQIWVVPHECATERGRETSTNFGAL